jgi:hypothetical protein
VNNEWAHVLKLDPPRPRGLRSAPEIPTVAPHTTCSVDRSGEHDDLGGIDCGIGIGVVHSVPTVLRRAVLRRHRRWPFDAKTRLWQPEPSTIPVRNGRR